MVTVPVSVPADFGLKVMVKVQLPPGASDAVQLLVAVYADPASLILLIVRLVLPVLVSVTICGGLVVLTTTVPKFKLLAESVAMGPVPVPVKLTVCGLLRALSVTVIAPVIVPVCRGEKVTEIVQLRLGCKLGGQVLVWL